MLVRKIVAFVISVVLVFASYVNPVIAANQGVSSISDGVINSQLQPAAKSVKDSIVIDDKIKAALEKAAESDATAQTPSAQGTNTLNNTEDHTASQGQVTTEELSPYVSKSFPQTDPAVVAIVQKFTKDGVLDYAGLAKYLQDTNDVELAAKVLEAFTPDIRYFTGEAPKGFHESEKKLIASMTDITFLDNVKKQVVADYNKDKDSGFAYWDIENSIDNRTKEIKKGDLRVSVEAKSVIDKFTKEGVVDYKGLASYLEKLGDAKLAASVIKALVVVQTGSHQSPPPIDASKAQELVNAINDVNLLTGMKQYFPATGNELQRMINAGAIQSINTRIAEIKIGTFEAKAVIDKFTKEGVVDYKGLASYLEKLGDAKLAASVIKALVVVQTGSHQSPPPIDASKAQELVNAINDVNLLTGMKQYFPATGNELQRMINAGAIQSINTRIADIKSGTVEAKSVIDKFTKEGVIDYAGLAKYLQNKGDAKLALKVLETLVDPMILRKYTEAQASGVKDDAAMSQLYYNTFGKVEQLIGQMSNVRFLESIKKAAGPLYRDIRVLNAESAADTAQQGEASMISSDLVAKINWKVQGIINRIDKRIEDIKSGTVEAKSVIDKFTREGVIDYAGLAKYLQNKGDAKLALKVLETLVDPMILRKYTEAQASGVKDDAAMSQLYYNTFGKVEQLIGQMSNVRFLESIKKAAGPLYRDIRVLNAESAADTAQQGEASMISSDLVAKINWKVQGIINRIDKRIADIKNVKAQTLIEKYTKDGVFNYTELAKYLQNSSDAGLAVQVIEALSKIGDTMVSVTTDRIDGPGESYTVNANVANLIDSMTDTAFLKKIKAGVITDKNVSMLIDDRIRAITIENIDSIIDR
jgi:hypothetical protein